MAVLKWYSTHILDTEGIQDELIKVEFDKRDQNNSDDDEYLYQANLMRLGDLSTLLMLVSWPFILDKQIE